MTAFTGHWLQVISVMLLLLPATAAASAPERVRVSGYYQLTEADLATLAARQAIIDAVAALKGQLFTERYQLVNTLQPLLRPIKRPSTDYAALLISTEPLSSDAAAAEPVADTSAAEHSAAENTAAENTATAVSAAAAAPAMLYGIDSDGLAQWQQLPEVASLPEAQLQQLAPLAGQIFLTEAMFGVALDSIGFAGATTDVPITTAEQSRLRQLVFDNGFKAGKWQPESAQPLQWQASAECGCAAQIVKQERFTNFSYGLVPYWQTQTTEIAFVNFNRIGLFGFTLGKDNKLLAPPNWQNSRHFNGFINLAQAHNTYLDLVVSGFDRISYQPLALDNLRAALVTQLTTPMDGFALNNLQPWLSFGLSARRTLADGVTFDLNLANLTEAEQLNFISFLRQLRADLNLGAEAANTDKYFINLKVPASAVLTAALPAYQAMQAEKYRSDTIYAPDKLATLAPLVNLLLVRFDADVMAAQQLTPQLAAPDKAQAAYPFRRQMKSLKTAIDSMPSADAATMLLEKMLPLFEILPLEQSGQLSLQDLANDLTYANWNFSGAAFWALPLSAGQYQVVNQAFTVAPAYQYQQLLQQVCDEVCPKRWFWRLVLASLLIAVASLYLLATLLYYPLLRYLEHPLLLYGAPLLFAIGLLLILSCDPYWHQFQSLILLAVLALVLLGFMLYRRMQQRRQHYP
ncbi:hypothetical protein [Rheinheimera pleomorphica]|uniref:hypothetical protein n=1 Tax=Rheinheimera pleomorphica TaxID=2703963 RepID=UPI00141EC539|nr:hypothetical protein [Rheinheimera pleomorphica]